MNYEIVKKIESVKVYYNGLRDGLRMYAHWKDGVQYVGTCGKTLAEAIKSINKEEEDRLNILGAEAKVE